MDEDTVDLVQKVMESLELLHSKVDTLVEEMKAESLRTQTTLNRLVFLRDKMDKFDD